VIAGLALAGAHVTIANRTHDKAAQLANQFNARAISGANQSRVEAVLLQNLSAHSFNAIVNCTSAGMAGGGGESIDPLPEAFQITSAMVVMDTVYRPRETPLLKRARSVGAVIVDGTEMFLRQAALQFELFTQDHVAANGATENQPSQLSLRKSSAANISSHTTSAFTVPPVDLWREILSQKLGERS
jgi:3-dehydroquinate dehydratase/shikimate dehydrogenase